MTKLAIAFFLTLSTWATFVQAEVGAGDKAPSFEAQDTTGKTHKLSDYKGKWLVLEWFNKDCPYVRKHYGSNNMQGLQAKYLGKKDKDGKELAWLVINSSAPGLQGHEDAKAAQATADSLKKKATAILLDPTGKMGKAYGAKVTPHMYVINPEGVVVYAGAIDDNPSANPDVIPKSKNFVVAALDAAMAGKEVEVKHHQPYGCTVKYPVK